MIKNFENPIISIKFSGKKPMSFQDFLEKYNDKANEFMSMIKNNIPLKVIKEQTGLNINNYSFAPYCSIQEDMTKFEKECNVGYSLARAVNAPLDVDILNYVS